MKVRRKKIISWDVDRWGDSSKKLQKFRKGLAHAFQTNDAALARNRREHSQVVVPFENEFLDSESVVVQCDSKYR